MAFLKYVPPMGIYETLYAFLAAFGRPMGDAGTHPWSQGFPRTDQLPGGPAMPTSVAIAPEPEYAALYAHFAELVRARRSDVDVQPLRLMTDALSQGSRVTTAPFTDSGIAGSRGA